jgi:SAM-dependent methyltransferase
MTGTWTLALDRRFYPQYGDNWDDTLLREHVLQVLRPGDRLLDLGAGAGIVPQMNFRGMAAEVCGVDPDPRVTENPYLDSAKVGTGEAIPYESDYFDVVVADNVVEHLTAPEAVLAEIRRVLKPGGRFLFKTPNAHHYMPLIARLTPTGFHRFYNRLRGRKSVDTFPTQYRANSASVVRRLAGDTGFAVEIIRRIEGRPEYLRLWAPLYLVGIAYERLINFSSALEPIRLVLIVQIRKQ